MVNDYGRDVQTGDVVGDHRGARGLGMLGSFLRLSLSEQLTTVRVIATALFVEAAIRTWSLPRVAESLGVALSEPRDEEPLSSGDPAWWGATQQRQLRCVRRVMRRWRLANGPCLRESLVIGHLLRRHRPLLRLGVARGGDAYVAHAWLEVAGMSIGEQDAFMPFDWRE
ncbi:MAG: lasso peptide biosynthesis B2 protein [Pseudonocardiaceae bacterium]